MKDDEYYLDALRKYGQTILVSKNATRGRALKLRQLAKDDGMEITFRKSAPRVIVLERKS